MVWGAAVCTKPGCAVWLLVMHSVNKGSVYGLRNHPHSLSYQDDEDLFNSSFIDFISEPQN